MVAFGSNYPPGHPASCDQLRNGAANALSPLQLLMLQKTGSVQTLCTCQRVVILSPSVFQYWLDRYILACVLGFEIYLAVLSLVAVLVEVL